MEESQVHGEQGALTERDSSLALCEDFPVFRPCPVQLLMGALELVGHFQMTEAGAGQFSDTVKI